jgi:hypothetical protein
LIGPVFLFFDDLWQLVFAASSEFLFIADDRLLDMMAAVVGRVVIVGGSGSFE